MAELVSTIILASDASHDPETKTTGYAFWIVRPGCEPIKIAGVSKKRAFNSTEAELIALAEGLRWLGMIYKPAEFKLIVYMDSKTAMLQARPGRPTKWTKALDVINYCQTELAKYYFEFRHVRAHSISKQNEGCEYNTWCDHASRSAMRKAKIAQSQ